MVWAPDYITAAELKSFERIADTVDDVEIALYVTGASRVVDEHCNRQFGVVAAAEERRYTAYGDVERGRYVVDVDDLQVTTDLAVVVDGVSIATYELEPLNAVLKGKAWTRLSFDPADVTMTGAVGEVYATGRWGWTAVPAPVKLATRLQASRFAARRESPYGIAGSPQDGSEMRLLARVDPDVGVALRGFVRPRRAG